MVAVHIEMRRFGARAPGIRRRRTGSSIRQIFDGRFEVKEQRFEVTRGDVVPVPSWDPTGIVATTKLDVFRCSDAPVDEVLGLSRHAVEE
jgi:gentisate 1,2-dioxygenase